MKKIYLAYASGIHDAGFVEKMRAVRDSVFSTSGVDPDRTCCTAVSADLFLGILDFWSEDLEIQIRIRAALKKPMALFHPIGAYPSATICQVVRQGYPSELGDPIFRSYTVPSDVADVIEHGQRQNGRRPHDVVRVVC